MKIPLLNQQIVITIQPDWILCFIHGEHKCTGGSCLSIFLTCAAKPTHAKICSGVKCEPCNQIF